MPYTGETFSDVARLWSQRPGATALVYAMQNIGHSVVDASHIRGIGAYINQPNRGHTASNARWNPDPFFHARLRSGERARFPVHGGLTLPSLARDCVACDPETLCTGEAGDAWPSRCIDDGVSGSPGVGNSYVTSAALRTPGSGPPRTRLWPQSGPESCTDIPAGGECGGVHGNATGCDFHSVRSQFAERATQHQPMCTPATQETVSAVPGPRIRDGMGRASHPGCESRVR